MKAIILAAGRGTRMHSLTENRSKVMLPIINKPVLEHLLVEVKKIGVTDFIFVVGYKDDEIRRYFGRGSKWQVNIDYCMQQEQLGTANAIRICEGLVNNNFLVMNGDNIIMSDNIQKIVDCTSTSIGIIEVDDTTDFGVIEVYGDRVACISEKVGKSRHNTINSGVYQFTPEVFEFISRTQKSLRGEYEITDSLQLMIDEGYYVHHQLLSHWLPLSYPWDLLSANEYFLKNIKSDHFGEVERGVILKGSVSIGKNTLVRSGSYIIGPVAIGENCDIGPNCYIRPYTSIGDDCHIGSAVEVKNSVIMRATNVPHHNYVGDSIIGEMCNLGAGTKIANLRLDKVNVKVGKVDTGRRKLGAIIGDNVETGINACINVGSIIGSNVGIGPGAVAHGLIPSGSMIIK